MNLDIRTMMVLFSVLNFLFSLLLGVASLHDRGIRGLRHWALASLAISFGFASAYTHFTPADIGAIVTGAGLLAAGSALQLLGIQAFKSQSCQWRILLLAVVVIVGQSLWFSLVQPDVRLRAVFNSVVYAAINLASARALLVPVAMPERTAYWLTGMSFLLFSVMYMIRAITIFLMPGGSYGLHHQIPVNSVIFFSGSITQLFLTFGFVLMVNYRLASELESLAVTDPLTGISNRRSLGQALPRLLSLSRRTQSPLSVMMLDIDRFKAINDRLGHLAGDEILRQLTLVVSKEIRGCDFLARYGGEEFCVLLPSTDEKEACHLAERLRHVYEQQSVYWHGHQINSTLCIGIASSTEIGLDEGALLTAADLALYRAKRSGRNRVVAHSQQLAVFNGS